MEELQPKDIEDLLQELEEESGAQESLPEEVEERLRVLQAGSEHLDRWDAAERLGHVETSSPRIVRALIGAYESDPSSMVNRAAAKSLRTPVHQKYLRHSPGLMEATERALQQRPGADRQRPRPNTIRPTDLEMQLKSVRWYDDWFGLALAARAILALISRAEDEDSGRWLSGETDSSTSGKYWFNLAVTAVLSGLVVGAVGGVVAGSGVWWGIIPVSYLQLGFRSGAIGGAVGGALAGIIQWFSLSRTKVWAWMVVSILAGSAAWAVASAWLVNSWGTGFSDESMGRTEVWIVVGIVVGAVGGAVAGTAQWFVLRGQISRARWWVVASILGWALGGAIFLPVMWSVLFLLIGGSVSSGHTHYRGSDRICLSAWCLALPVTAFLWVIAKAIEGTGDRSAHRQ